MGVAKCSQARGVRRENEMQVAGVERRGRQAVAVGGCGGGPLDKRGQGMSVSWVNSPGYDQQLNLSLAPETRTLGPTVGRQESVSSMLAR